MSSDLSTIEESIKIALDAADAATDVTSEYNKVKREHKKLETKVKQIHRYTTIIFGSSMIAAIVAMIFSSVLYFRSMSDLGVMTTTPDKNKVIKFIFIFSLKIFFPQNLTNGIRRVLCQKNKTKTVLFAILYADGIIT